MTEAGGLQDRDQPGLLQGHTGICRKALFKTNKQKSQNNTTTSGHGYTFVSSAHWEVEAGR